MNYMRWIPVSCRTPDEEYRKYRERYPFSEFEVIVFIEGASIPTFLGYDGTGFYVINLDGEYEDEMDYLCVTHWMMMPPSPAECMVHQDLGDQIEANFELLEAFLA